MQRALGTTVECSSRADAASIASSRRASSGLAIRSTSKSTGSARWAAGSSTYGAMNCFRETWLLARVKSIQRLVAISRVMG
jgi:hypothetical protein